MIGGFVDFLVFGLPALLTVFALLAGIAYICAPSREFKERVSTWMWRVFGTMSALGLVGLVLASTTEWPILIAAGVATLGLLFWLLRRSPRARV